MDRRKDFCVLTIAKNEWYFLPIWIKYYLKYAPPEDLYLLDHQSTDGSTDNIPINVEVIKNDEVLDHDWILKEVNRKQGELFKEYKVVIFTEIDEIIYHKNGLGSYARAFSQRSHNIIKTNGIEIYQQPDEPPIDLRRPIMSQREWCFNMPGQCKPNMTKIVPNYAHGFHDCQEPSHKDRNLWHFHLRRMDRDLLYVRNVELTRMKRNQRDIDRLLGIHKDQKDREEFEIWFDSFRAKSAEIKLRKFNKDWGGHIV